MKYALIRTLPIVSLLLSALILINKPTQAQTPTTSFYRAWITGDTALAAYSDGWRNFSTTSFDTRQDGLYILAGDTFTTARTGLVRLTLNCRQGKVSRVGIRVLSPSYLNVPFEIVNTEDEAFSASIVLLGGNFQLQAYNYDVGRYDPLKCDLALEAVE